MQNLRSPNLLAISLALGLLGACSGNPPAAPAARVEPGSAAPALVVAPSASAEDLALDRSASTVGFVASKVTASHDGRFADVSGHVRLDAADVARSNFDVRVGIASLAIEPARLLGHLLTPDLLDAARFPEASFRSTAIAPAAAGYTVTGDMTIHGQTKRITFPATISVSATGVTADAEMTLDRRDFGVVYPGMPDDLIRDAVVLRVHLVAPRTAR